MTPEEKLESYKLSAITLKKSGHAAEQNPFPVLDPISRKPYDVELNKTYLMPSYMEAVLNDCFRPMYETNKDAQGNLTQFKRKDHIPLNMTVKSLTVPKEKFLDANPDAAILFSVDNRLIEEVKAQIKGVKPAATKKGAAASEKVPEDDLVATFE